MRKPRIRKHVQRRYGASALRVLRGDSAGCGCDPCGGAGYDPSEIAALPRGALLASLGCGNPTALAELHEGETVLDLGSGGGIDVLLSARRVAPSGKAYGLDMTADMITLARENQRKAGLTNVEFLHGTIERIPLPAASVDVIISNCVINLSPDKPRVLQEAFRVLKAGGRLAVADVVVDGTITRAVRDRMELWVGCAAGALDKRAYRRLLTVAGFVDIGIEPTGIYAVATARGCCGGPEVASRPGATGASIIGAFIRARKPS